ncbi:hypothetical protein ASE04_03965 [Rhizobium sp. Root708]|uniref:hypothetical protein n=1 Tax=Rhizobium sp. Root708 TaxID=1736592 RepID=UPI0006F8ED90|nr:hypothetical protein [Rhizobium sp. Root708]KRB58862.1 hypothetical protein ASE04_03965 [Rhizobium sp. Root708]
MSRVAFRQSDMERVVKAAGRAKAFVQIDMKTLIVTIIPSDQQKPVDEEGNPLGILPSGNYAPDGKENWDEE